MSEQAGSEPNGFFIDFDGNVRPVDKPGKGLRCEVDLKAKYVAVYNKYGVLDHESTFYPTLADVEAAGIRVNLAKTD